MLREICAQKTDTEGTRKAAAQCCAMAKQRVVRRLNAQAMRANAMHRRGWEGFVFCIAYLQRGRWFDQKCAVEFAPVRKGPPKRVCVFISLLLR